MNSRLFLVIDSHPVQYRVPIYKLIATKLAAENLRFHVIYGSNSSIRGAIDSGFATSVAWDEPMLDGYSYEFLPDAEIAFPGRFVSISGRHIAKRIYALKPEVVFLNGINYLLFLRALLACRKRRIPAWLRSETQEHAFVRSNLKSLCREWIYRIAYAQFAHFFPIGKLNAAHYRAHGVSEECMTFCHYCVVDRFQDEPAVLAARREAKRQMLGISSEVTVVLFSGKLIEKKYPKVLIEAWRLIPLAEQKQFMLLFMGSGEQLSELKIEASYSGAPAIFAGFVNQSEVAEYYLASDVVILPSRQMGETWGLVANEALLAGKPLILSKNAGSSADFYDFPGVQVVEPTAEAISNALKQIKDRPSDQTLRSLMHNYTIEAAAQAIAQQFLKPK